MSATRSIARATLMLAGVGLLAVLLLAGIERLTRESILDADRQAERDALAIVLPPDRYDNAPLEDAIQVSAPHWLGVVAPLTVLRARRHDQPVALLLHVVAPDGYAGPIQLLVAVNADGSISGVRVTAHQETPGLGDKIEAAKSPWIEGFNGRSLSKPPPARWTVRKEGGDFDQFAGATVTPRAVIHALARALQFVAMHGDELYAAKPGSRLHFDDTPTAHP